jgi:hypothetical protein
MCLIIVNPNLAGAPRARLFDSASHYYRATSEHVNKKGDHHGAWAADYRFSPTPVQPDFARTGARATPQMRPDGFGARPDPRT